MKENISKMEEEMEKETEDKKKEYKEVHEKGWFKDQ